MPGGNKSSHIQYLKGRMVDLDALRQEIKQMDRHSLIYRVLKEELTVLGYWKMRARGNPSKGYQAQQRTLARG
ncbi:hypothetical protein LCGC14_1412300 [marine sediment metagenome]|uniref:Uncharacterized protein n=1 Tax=marine sediment metagenome TaxID=412755 RepID=A0A0F9KEZ3_9ZZZZ